MEILELKEALMQDAKADGICAEGYGKMRGYDRDELINYYLTNPDWCLQRRFPSIRLLRTEFSDIEDRGVFVEKKFNGETLDRKQVYVFHHCEGKIKVAMDYDNAVIPMLYFANGCKITIECEQINFPPIMVPVFVVEDGRTQVEGTDNEWCNFRYHSINIIPKNK